MSPHRIGWISSCYYCHSNNPEHIIDAKLLCICELDRWHKFWQIGTLSLRPLCWRFHVKLPIKFGAISGQNWFVSGDKHIDLQRQSFGIVDELYSFLGFLAARWDGGHRILHRHRCQNQTNPYWFDCCLNLFGYVSMRVMKMTLSRHSTRTWCCKSRLWQLLNNIDKNHFISNDSNSPNALYNDFCNAKFNIVWRFYRRINC